MSKTWSKSFFVHAHQHFVYASCEGSDEYVHYTGMRISVG